MKISSEILFYVNGARRTVCTEVALSSLLSYLRNTERLTGAKLGCGEGGCGACTVLLSTFDHNTRKVSHRAVNACLVPLAAVDGGAVTTIEAVGDRCGGLAPVQMALINMHGSQCGFCTPGIVMSMFALLRQRAAEGKQIKEEDVEGNFDGNLCRCTGYRPILDAFKGLMKHEEKDCGERCVLGENCCRRFAEDVGAVVEKKNGVCGGLEEEESGNKAAVAVDSEYIFPPELVTYIPVELNVARGRWLRPVSLERFVHLKVEHPQARIIVGNTELGVESRFKGLRVDTFLCASHIPELLEITKTEQGLRIGASVTWTQLNNFIDHIFSAAKSDDTEGSKFYRYGSLQAIRSQLRWFAGKQIRNVAAISGNIVTASPISDMNPIWIAADAHFIVLNSRTSEERHIPARDFFLSYRKVDMLQDEILLCVLVPWNESPFDLIHAFKISRRREDDIAIVSAGIRLRLELEQAETSTHDTVDASYHFRIAEAYISYGGLAPKTIAMEKLEAYLRGQPFSEETLQRGLLIVAENAKLPNDVPGGMPEFRQSLAVSFLFKAFIITATQVDEYFISNGTYSVPSLIVDLGINPGKDYFAGLNDHGVSRGVQISSDREPKFSGDYTGKSVKHLSAALQVSGEAKYLDDIAAVQGELQGALVLSTEAHAKILTFDSDDALKMTGVYYIVTRKDVKGINLIGPNVQDEFCFAEDLVTTVGQVLGVVLADTLEQAKEAAKAVRITYERLPSVITIEDAIAANSFAPGVPEHTICKGSTANVLRKAVEDSRVVQGTVRIGAQEHWYLEPQGTIAIPEENGEMTIISSTQAAAKTQEVAAKVLGEPMHKVVCKVKRLGGAFGGKESRSLFISAAAAVAAQTARRPVRLILDRDTDMLITGTRHAFLARYRAAYDSSGRITALELRVYSNMGNTVDLSIPVLDRCLYHAVNCYDIPNVDFVGRACLTNTASATAFRGFGGPQGMMIAENVIEHVAWAAQLSPVAVREINLYGKHENSAITPFGMSFNVKPLLSCWDTVLKDSAYIERRDEVSAFNEVHEFRKRGIAAIPTMFGISFTFKTYNQAGALVHIFHGDGSVLISHGGVEMGQGLHTKVCQVAATELGVRLEKVFISETATDKVPNASPTAASSSSDMYGMAVKRACEQLNENLKLTKSELGPEATWEQVVHHAWFNRVNLSATGFYKTPELDAVNLGEAGAQGRPFYYYTNGAAVSEVEIDILTGECKLLRTDISMDVGRPLNPAIDVGQIEGAFIQGLGWCTMEEVVRGSANTHKWIKEGQTLTLGPGTYKIPGFNDIPKDFRVRVLNTHNEKDTIHSSKAIGEPPLFLAASAFFAIRDAIRASRLDRDRSEWFELDSPATVERIKMTAAFTPSHAAHMDQNFRAQLSL